MNIKTLWAVIRFILTTITLFIVWLMFTSSLAPFSIIVGILGSLGISILTYNVFIPEYGASRISLIPKPLRLIKYSFLIIYYIYSSSIKTLIAVIKNNPKPNIVHFRTRLHTDFGRMILANSITITPGTITLDLNDDHLTVHWFLCNTNHSKLAGELVKGKMEEHLKKIWP